MRSAISRQWSAWPRCLVVLLIGLAACTREPAGMPGTLEYDHITLPATAAEPLREVLVHEGETVAAGTVLLRQDGERLASRHAAAIEEVARARENLHLVEAGFRRESQQEARARLQAAEATARNALQQTTRVRQLVARGVLPAAQLDAAEAELAAAEAQVAAQRAAGELLAHGNRAQEIAAARAVLRGAEARVAELDVDSARLEVRAPRAGRIDSLPYKPGDQPPVGAPLAVMLVGEAPYARIYVPAPQLAAVRVGSRLEVQVEGSKEWRAGTVRAVRSQPTFTPYYALTGEDASRLAYLAEVQLSRDAAVLPAGLPLHARPVVDGR